jgi:hypothetical protein
VSGTPELTFVPQTTDGEEVIVGGDTHKDFHVAAVITALLLGSKTLQAIMPGMEAITG